MRTFPFSINSEMMNIRLSGEGARLRPMKRQILGCRHSFMSRHSRSKYLATSYSVDGRTSLIATSIPRYVPDKNVKKVKVTYSLK